MDSTPMISVIVPVYRVEKYLASCVRSLINQTFENLEIILVNDGSPDKCGELCDKYSLSDSRIKVIHKVNGGLSSARNAGLSVARGEYIGFVDSDDYISPDMYEILYGLCEKFDAKLSACNFFYIFDDEVKVEEETRDYSVINNIDFFRYLLESDNRIEMVAWNKLYHKSIFENNKAPFPEGKFNEDLATMYQFVFSVDKVAYIDKALYYYRRLREGAITTLKYKKENEKNRLDFEDAMVSFVRCNVPEIEKEAVTFKCVNGDLSVANCMVQSRVYDLEMIKRIKHDIRKERKYWMSSNVPILKKIQLSVCMCSFRLYELMMLKMKYNQLN